MLTGSDAFTRGMSGAALGPHTQTVVPITWCLGKVNLLGLETWSNQDSSDMLSADCATFSVSLC